MKTGTTTLIIFALVSLLCPSVLRGQDPEMADTLQTVVFSARQEGNYLSKGKDLRVEVITTEGLHKMACCNLAESFENSASVTVGYTDAVTGARQIRLLGLSGVYTQMLDENRPVMRGLASPFGLGLIPGQWLESIQVAKGSPSVLNGSESMTGQINLEHRKPTDSKPLFLNFTGMSDSRLNLDAVSSLPLSDRLFTSIFAHVDGNTRTYDMNDDSFVDDPKALQFNFANRWVYYAPSSALVHFGVKAISDHRKGGQKGYDSSTFDFVGDSPWGSVIDNQSLGAYVKVGIPLREDQSSSIAAIADYTYYKLDAHFGASSYLGKQHSGFLNILYLNEINESHSFTLGASATLDGFDEDLYRLVAAGSSGEKMSPTLLVGGICGEYTFHGGEALTAILGTRLDAYKGEGVRFVPRATLKYQPVEPLVLRLNGGRGLRYSNPLTDNLGVFSTGKRFLGDYTSHPLEDSWTWGGNATFYFSLTGEGSDYLSFDFFRTRFVNQMVADWEHVDGAIDFYETDKSYSNNFQVDLALAPFEGFTVNLTGRYTQAKVSLADRGVVERPLVSRYKAVANFQYRTHLSRWIFDFTASLNGSCRLYDFMEDERSDVYPLLYAQVTRRFKGFDIFVGGENLTNFTQKDVLLGSLLPSGGIDTRSSSFDASAVWGPLMGIRIEAGIRLTIWK